VFAADATVALALTVVGLPERLAGEEIPRYGDALLAAARRVTRSIRGQVPPPPPAATPRGGRATVVPSAPHTAGAATGGARL